MAGRPDEVSAARAPRPPAGASAERAPRPSAGASAVRAPRPPGASAERAPRPPAGASAARPLEVAVTRRRLLSLAGAGAASGLLVACGASPRGAATSIAARSAVAVDYASYYPPIADLRRLALAHAATRQATVTFSADAAGAAAQRASLARLAGPDGGFRAVVVAPFDAAGLAAVAAAARRHGTALVGLLETVPQQSAAITFDVEAAACLLARDAARHAADRDVVLVLPPARSPVPDPLMAFARRAAEALRRELAAAGLRTVRTVRALGQADVGPLLGANVRTVLTWNEQTAIGAAHAIANDGYVGGLAVPSVSAGATLESLDAGGPLRALVAPRLSDMAAAIVDVPLAIAQGRPARSAALAPRLFARGAAVTRAARADYEA